MALTKTQETKIKFVIEKLRKQNCGCVNHLPDATVNALNDKGVEVVSRRYIDTWILPELESILLSGKK